MNDKIKIGITQGDINGVSYELIIKTLSDARILDFCTPVIYGLAKTALFYRKNLDAHSFNFHTVSDISELNSNRINLVNCTEENIEIEFGQASDKAGKAAYASLERSAQDLKNGQIDALVTAPLNKNTIPADKNFGGHSQFFENIFEEKGQSLQLLLNNVMRIAILAAPVSKELIVEKLRKLKKSLVEDFSINLPRIAVLKLSEAEENIIVAAIQEAEAEGIICVGTYEAEDFFNAGKFEKFDAVLAMNYEQVKTFLREDDVCYTAGLSAIITAAKNAVEYENAGKNITSEDAFRNALYLAVDVFHRRKIYKEISAAPLVVKNKK